MAWRNALVVALIILVLTCLVLHPQRRPSAGPRSEPSREAPAASGTEPERPDAAERPTATIAAASIETVEARPREDDPAFERFAAWVRDWRADRDPRRAAAGLELARARREALKRLIESDPERALALALPYADRKALPPEFVALLEERVSGRGALLQAISTDGAKRYSVEFPDRAFDAFVYGRRVDQSIAGPIPLHGIAIDAAFAVHEWPARLLEPEEAADLPAGVAGTCPVSGAAVVGRAVALVGGALIPLCQGGHIEGLNERLTLAEGSSTPAVLAAPSPWVTGPKKLLYIRIDFSDLPGEPVTQATAQSTLDGAVSSFFVATSFSQTSIGPTTVTPVLRMPKTAATYRSSTTTLLSDARATARTAGYDTAAYNLDIVAFKAVYSGWSGMAYVGAKGVWLNGSFGAGVTRHELGHNYGLYHANFWKTTDGTSIGAGSNQEYGNVFDTMGSSGSNGQFNSNKRYRLGWLPAANVATVTSAGDYRVTALDASSSLNPGAVYAIKVTKDSDRDYWLEFRQQFTSNAAAMNGAVVLWDPWAQSNRGSQLLDMTPETTSKSDAPLGVGKTFSDRTNADSSKWIHFTVLGKGGTVPESLNVRVSFGANPGSPSVSLTASPASVTSGSPITVSWSSSSTTLMTSDTIGMFAAGSATLLDSRAATGQPSGSVTFTAPSSAGTYEFRYRTAGGATLATSNAVTVSAAGVIGNGTGVTGQYYDNADFTALRVTRTDATVDFDWSSGSPDASIGPDGFSVRWTGQVQAQFSETYTFTTVSDDGVRLWVNGVLVVSNWTDHAPVENTGSISLAAGQKVDLRMEYYENGGGAVARLLWSSPSTVRQPVPTSQLYPSSVAPTGTGLTAQYFDDRFLQVPMLTRTDATVDFNWGSGSPAPSIAADTFSARWTGQVQAAATEAITFYTVSDDGIRLWIDGVLVIDNWTDHGPTENSATVSLSAGQRVSVRMEYYENGGGAVARLLWSSPTITKRVIPQSQLFPQ
jgi:hypothetical protein